jgi:NADH:ubiquinone oxidoreductase subunit B-like Fe-S oxidoreductase
MNPERRLPTIVLKHGVCVISQGIYYLQFTYFEIVKHRSEIVQHVRKTALFISRFGTRVATVALAKRPLGIWWSMFQVRGCVRVSMA